MLNDEDVELNDVDLVSNKSRAEEETDLKGSPKSWKGVRRSETRE